MSEFIVEEGDRIIISDKKTEKPIAIIEMGDQPSGVVRSEIKIAVDFKDAEHVEIVSFAMRKDCGDPPYQFKIKLCPIQDRGWENVKVDTIERLAKLIDNDE